MAYIGKSPTGTGVRSRYYYTATAGATSLSGADDNSNTLVFSDGNYVDVSLNGIALVAGTDYNTSTTNTIAGLAALSAGDIVEVVVYDIFGIADTVSAKNGGTFSGNITVNGAINATSFSGDITSVARVSEQVSSNAGASTSGSWVKRALNTEEFDPDNIVTLSSNQFTLGAGKYLLYFDATGYKTGRHTAKIYNVTDTADVGKGLNAYGASGYDVNTVSSGMAFVNITGSKVFELQWQCTASKATNGLGSGGSGNISPNTFSSVTVLKVG